MNRRLRIVRTRQGNRRTERVIKTETQKRRACVLTPALNYELSMKRSVR